MNKIYYILIVVVVVGVVVGVFWKLKKKEDEQQRQKKGRPDIEPHLPEYAKHSSCCGVGEAFS